MVTNQTDEQALQTQTNKSVPDWEGIEERGVEGG